MVKLDCTDFKTDKDDQTLNQTIFAAGTSEKDIVFDIHFNAASPNAGGCETFIPNEFTAREKKIAKEITDTTCKILGIANRGVKLESQTFFFPHTADTCETASSPSPARLPLPLRKKFPLKRHPCHIA